MEEPSDGSSFRPPIYAYGVFQGGGAKGLAHIGALQAAEDVGVRFIGVAGASAGAIVAALAAVGYRASDIFDTAAGTHILGDESPINLLDKVAWRFLSLIRGLEASPVALNFALGWLLSPLIPYYLLACYVRRKGGVLSSEGIVAKLNYLLHSKISANLDARGLPPLDDHIVRFRHLSKNFDLPSCIPLKIVVTDIERNRLVVFSSEGTPDVSVAEAAAGSAAVPFLFEPVAIAHEDQRNPVYLDGGLSANLPVWVFSEEKRAAARRYDSVLPIIAFAFREEKATRPLRRFWLIELLLRAAGTSLVTSQVVTRDFIEDLVIVPLECELGLLDLDAKRLRIARAIRSATGEAYQRLDWVLIKRPAAIQRSLAALCTVADAHFVAHGETPTIRASFVEPVRRKLGRHLNFRVTEAYRFDGDADDTMYLDVANSGAPKSFADREPSTWPIGPVLHGKPRDHFMSKYERALVRRSLVSAISIPVFKDDGDWNRPANKRGEPLGIMTLDSDADLEPLFNDDGKKRLLIKKTQLLAEILRSNDDRSIHA